MRPRREGLREGLTIDEKKINNKEKLMGVSVPGVFVVVAGVYTTTAVYFKTLPAAGWVLLPSCVWLTVACCLVTT